MATGSKCAFVVLRYPFRVSDVRNAGAKCQSPTKYTASRRRFSWSNRFPGGILIFCLGSAAFLRTECTLEAECRKQKKGIAHRACCGSYKWRTRRHLKMQHICDPLQRPQESCYAQQWWHH